MTPWTEVARSVGQLGRYELLVQLGRGGMAEVHAGRLRGEGGFAKLVAIKRMLPHLLDDETLVQRFLDEARLAAFVESPHVVSTLDVGRDARGGPYIVLELVVGVTLARLFAAGADALGLADRVDLVLQAAYGLADVHRARGPGDRSLGMVHRDVSPQNVLVGVDGRARLADFGIARADVPRARTATGVVLGKAGYMAPEQLRGDGLDGRTDVFALGVVLHEALTLRRLRSTARSSPSELAASIAEEAIPPIRWSLPELPAGLAAVVDRALSTDPADRFADAGEMAAALRAAAPGPSSADIADHVRRAGGEALAELRRTLDEARMPGAAERATRTLSIDFTDVTVSGAAGLGWDPHASTAPLAPSEPTEIDEPDAGQTVVDGSVPSAQAPPRMVSIQAQPTRTARLGVLVAIAAAALALGVGGALVLTTSDHEPDEAPRPPVAAATEEAPSSSIDAIDAADEAAPDEPGSEAPEAITADPVPTEPAPSAANERRPRRLDPTRNRANTAPRPRTNGTGEREPGHGVVGLDRFDEEAR